MTNTDVKPPRRRLVYFINCFPNLIETMIYREVLALRSLGNDVFTFSIRRPDPLVVPVEARELRDLTFYILPVSVLRLLAAHARTLARYRLRYWHILKQVVGGTHFRMRDRLRTLCHFAEAVTVLREVEQLGPDHLHAHWAVGATTCAMVVSRFLEIPFTFTAHAYDIWREQLLLPEKLDAATVVVTCTDFNRYHLARTYPVDGAKLRVVHHGVDTEQFRPLAGEETREPLILSVGRLVEQKGFDRLLRAYSILASEGQRFRAEIVGEGPLRKDLEQLAEMLGLNGRVGFRGQLFQEELKALYAKADAFALICVPASDNDRDGIPNTMIEAMAMQLPVVSTRFSGIPELVVDGLTGSLVDPDSPDALVDALRRLLSDPSRRQEMGRAARKRVLDGFTIEASAGILNDLFDELCASGNASARGAA